MTVYFNRTLTVHTVIREPEVFPCAVEFGFQLPHSKCQFPGAVVEIMSLISQILHIKLKHYGSLRLESEVTDRNEVVSLLQNGTIDTSTLLFPSYDHFLRKSFHISDPVMSPPSTDMFVGVPASIPEGLKDSLTESLKIFDTYQTSVWFLSFILGICIMLAYYIYEFVQLKLIRRYNLLSVSQFFKVVHAQSADQKLRKARRRRRTRMKMSRNILILSAGISLLMFGRMYQNLLLTELLKFASPLPITNLIDAFELYDRGELDLTTTDANERFYDQLNALFNRREDWEQIVSRRGIVVENNVKKFASSIGATGDQTCKDSVAVEAKLETPGFSILPFAHVVYLQSQFRNIHLFPVHRWVQKSTFQSFLFQKGSVNWTILLLQIDEQLRRFQPVISKIWQRYEHMPPRSDCVHTEQNEAQAKAIGSGRRKHDSVGIKVLNLKAISGAFLVWSIGLAVSGAVCIFEKVRHVIIHRENFKMSSQIVNVAKVIAEAHAINMGTDTQRRTPKNGKLEKKLSMSETTDEEVLEMLNNADELDQQLSLLHYLYIMKKNLDFSFDYRSQPVTIRRLLNEVYSVALHKPSWAHVRLSAGLLDKKHTGLPKAVTHLLVRQKQITVGTPSINEIAITTPKSTKELHEIMSVVYANEPNAHMLAQEIIVILGSIVRTDPRLFVEMFRLRIALIIQILASELALSGQKKLTPEEACDELLSVSPYELKRMLYDLLRGKLFDLISHACSTPTTFVTPSGNDTNKPTEALPNDGLFVEEEANRREKRSGLMQMKKKIEARKSRRSMHLRSIAESPIEGNTNNKAKSFHTANNDESEESDFEEEAPFAFDMWLRHRRIDGALNRVPPDFYAVRCFPKSVWDTLRRFPHGMVIGGNTLLWGLTQEMTRNEMKFALHVEQVLNQVAEPEYRQLCIEALSLLGASRKLLKVDEARISQVAAQRPFVIDDVIHAANAIFVKHNRELETVVTECCAALPLSLMCAGARGICEHFYDSAPAGEYGTAHYLVQAIVNAFAPN